MKYEIERKFLVKGDYKSKSSAFHRIMQGYLSTDSPLIVRVRIADDKAYLTIKSTVDGSEFTRYEWEYEIPLKEAGRYAEIVRKIRNRKNTLRGK